MKLLEVGCRESLEATGPSTTLSRRSWIPPAAGGLGGRVPYTHNIGEFGGRVGLPLVLRGFTAEFSGSMKEEWTTPNTKKVSTPSTLRV